MYLRVFKQKGSRVYRARFRLSNGPRIFDVPLGVPTKELAESRAREIYEDRERELLGIPRRDKIRDAANQSVGEHLERFIAMLTEGGRNKVHVRQSRGRLSALFAACRVRYLGDMTPEAFEAWRSKQEGLSNKTLNEYLAHGRTFFNWLVRKGRFPENPLKSVEKLPEERTFHRRALSLEELRRLIAGCGDKWRLAYLFAAGTGARRGEMQQVRWSDLDLDLESERPCLILRPETTKNKQGGRIRLIPQLVDMLRLEKQREEHVSGLIFWRGLPRNTTLAKDLKACGISVVDERGHRLDFHALRHTYVSVLAELDTPDAVRQSLARHRSLKMTYRYTDEKSLPVETAIAKFSAALPSSIASPNFGNPCPKGGKPVQDGDGEGTAQVVPIIEETSTLAKAVPAWENLTWRRGRDSNPRYPFEYT